MTSLFKTKTIIGSFETINPQLARKYMFAARYVKGKNVLDLGCASGYGSHYLADEGGAKNVIGVDISKKAIETAKNEYRLPNLEYLCGNAEKLPFADGAFDTVVSLEVIEHVDNYKNYLCEIKRVLKPKCILILSTPNKAISSPNLKYPLMTSHVKEFYIDELKTILKGYFGKVTLKGETPESRGYDKEVMQHHLSVRGKAQRIISQITFIRLLTRYTPQRLNDIFTGGRERPSGLKIEEVKITPSPRGAETIIAVCTSPMGYAKVSS